MSDELLHKRMPRMRKVTLGVVLSMAFTNSVLLVVTLVRPVPQFSSSGTLFTITSSVNQYDHANNNTDTAARTQTSGNRQASGGLARRSSNTPVTMYSAIVEVIDAFPQPGSRPSDEFKEVADKQANTIDHTVHLYRRNWFEGGEPSDSNADVDGDESFKDPDEEDDNANASNSISHHPGNCCTASRTDHTVTQAKSQASSTPFPQSQEIERQKSSAQKQTEKPKHSFESMFIGPLGVCLLYRNGTVACTSASMSPTWDRVYAVSTLNDEIQARLPKSPGGAPVAILMAALAYILATFLFGYSLSPPFKFKTPYGPQKNLDTRHSTALSLNTVVITLAMFFVLIPTFMLRASFVKIVNSIPAYDPTLNANMGGAFAQLYACCIIGGLILLQSMTLVSEDLRYPWWLLYNTFRRNPFQTTSRGINFTPHRGPPPQQAHDEVELYIGNAQQHSASQGHYPVSHPQPPVVVAPRGPGSVFIPSARPELYKHRFRADPAPPVIYY